MAWGLGVDGRPAEGLQAPHRAPKALCGSCDARDGERIRSRGLSRPGWREIAGTLGQLQAGRQAGNANGVGFPRPAPGEILIRPTSSWWSERRRADAPSTKRPEAFERVTRSRSVTLLESLGTGRRLPAGTNWTAPARRPAWSGTGCKSSATSAAPSIQ